MLGVASSGPSSSISDRRLKLGREGVLLSRDVAEEQRHDLDGAEEEDEEHQVDLQFHTAVNKGLRIWWKVQSTKYANYISIPRFRHNAGAGLKSREIPPPHGS